MLALRIWRQTCSKEEAENSLQITRGTLNAWIKKGILREARVCGFKRIYKTSVDEVLERPNYKPGFDKVLFNALAPANVALRAKRAAELALQHERGAKRHANVRRKCKERKQRKDERLKVKRQKAKRRRIAKKRYLREFGETERLASREQRKLERIAMAPARREAVVKLHQQKKEEQARLQREADLKRWPETYKRWEAALQRKALPEFKRRVRLKHESVRKDHRESGGLDIEFEDESMFYSHDFRGLGLDFHHDDE